MEATLEQFTATDQLERPSWLDQKQWPFALRSFSLRRRAGDEVIIHYTDEGSGPVLLFVHAGMWSFIWRDVIADLARGFRCITLDFPGSGLSSGRRSDIDLASYPSIVDGLLNHCGVDEATLVLHDLGGVVGVLAAAERPERVAGLVATNCFAWPADRRPLTAMLRVMGSPLTTATLGSLRVIPRLSCTGFGVGRHMDAPSRKAFFGPFRQRARSRNLHRTMRSAASSRDLFERAELALSTSLNHVAVLTVFGEKNDQFGFADRWKSMYPGAAEWVVSEGSHFPMCDDPAGFAAEIRRWHAAEVASTSPH